MQQLRGCEDRPHACDRRAELDDVSQALTQRLEVHVGIASRCSHRSNHLGLDEATRGVVSPIATTRLLDDASTLLGAETQVARAIGNDEVFAQRTLAIADRIRDDTRHAHVTLHTTGLVRLTQADAVTGNEIGENLLLDSCFTERRQHALDVAEEHTVRSDHEHALVFEWETMRVQQIRGAVQRDDRLAGSGATLHDEHARMRRANDLVLFRLDRRDDVTELTGAPTTECGEQRAVAADALATDDARQTFIVTDTEVSFAEQFIFDPEQRAALDGEVTTTNESHRLATRRSIERLGHWRAPVDDDRLSIEVRDRETTDVETLEPRVPLCGPVDPPEDEGGIPEVQLGEASEQLLVEGIALVAGLEGAAGARLIQVADAPGVGLGAFEAVVRSVDVGLFGLVVGVRMAHFGVHQLYRP